MPPMDPDKGRLITVLLPADLLQHLDRRAAERTLSRAAMVRTLILADRDRPKAA